MNSLIILFDQIITLYTWILIVNVVFSWLLAMNIFNTQNRIIIAIYFGTKRLTDPLLNPLRNFLPNLGGIDISPVVLILILYFIRNLLYEYFYLGIAI
jgi:YggT family protein